MTDIKFEKIDHPHPLIAGMIGNGVDISKVEFRLIKRATGPFFDIVGTNDYTCELLDKNRPPYSDATWRSIIQHHFFKSGDYMIAGGEWFYRDVPYQYIWVFGQNILWNGEYLVDKNDKMMWDSCNIEYVIKSLTRLLENKNAG